MTISPGRMLARIWLMNWWARRSEAEALLQEYQQAAELKLFSADVARFCNAGDSSLDPDPQRTAANEGRREFWLHFRAMARLDETDTETLLERTEQ